MSIHAISWVMKLDVARSSEKFLLVCLANYADESGIAYPSITTLCRDTAQDRKTIMSNLLRLIDVGLLEDTGRRVGDTGSIPVYRLSGLPGACDTHFVYRTYHPDTGEYYIGKRSFNGDPEQDSYRGSGRWVRDMQAKGAVLLREVLEEFETAEEAFAAEVRMFRQIDGDPLCKNDQLQQLSIVRSKGKTVPLQSAKQSQISHEAVPNFRDSGTVFPSKQYQKRDIEPSMNHQKEPKGKPSGRASRLAADWQLPEDWQAWALGEQATWNPSHALRVAEQFRDYWIAVPGAKGRKTDWEATWRNWVRREKPMRAEASTELSPAGQRTLLAVNEWLQEGK